MYPGSRLGRLWESITQTWVESQPTVALIVELTLTERCRVCLIIIINLITEISQSGDLPNQYKPD